MHNKKRGIIVIAITLCIVLVCCYRYKKVNKGIPKTYEKQEYHVGENIKLENLNFKVKSYKYTKPNKDDVDLILDLNIKNTGTKIIDASSVILNSRLATDFDYEEGPDLKNEEFDNFKNLKPNNELNFKLIYSLRDNFKDENELKFYIPNKFYKKEIIKKYKNLKFYSKYVSLKR